MLDSFTGVNSLNFHNCAFYYFTFTHFSLSLSLLFTGRPVVSIRFGTCQTSLDSTIYQQCMNCALCCQPGRDVFSSNLALYIRWRFPSQGATVLQQQASRVLTTEWIQWHPSLKTVLTTTHIWSWKEGWSSAGFIYMEKQDVCVWQWACVCVCGEGGCQCVLWVCVCMLAHIYYDCVLLLCFAMVCALNLEKQRIKEYNIIITGWKKWPSKWQGWSFFIRLLFCKGLHCLLSLYTTEIEVITKWKWSLD